MIQPDEHLGSLTNPHDQFFRMAMSDERVSKEFLRTHLPPDLIKAIDFTVLKLEPRSYINDVRKESTVDVLFKTRIDGQAGYLYLLLEHQSKPDRLMPFRLLKYVCNVIDRHLQDHKSKKIPLIYPLVVYHAKRPYPYSNRLEDIVDAPKVPHLSIEELQTMEASNLA